jgi:hypothetical protein
LHLAIKKGAAVVLDTTAITLFGNADHASYPCRSVRRGVSPAVGAVFGHFRDCPSRA